MNQDTIKTGIHKFLVALATAASVFVSAMADGTITASEGRGIIIAFIGAFFVYRIPNPPR